MVHINVPVAEPLQHWPCSNRPIKILHVDFAEIEVQHLFVLIDVHFKWIKAISAGEATTVSTIHVIRHFFAGALFVQLVTGEGPRFTSYEFQHFYRMNGIRQIVAPSYHKASNGADELAV